jgi:DUF1365 family protein
MHVSPFMPMEVGYHWVLSPPAEQLSVFMANSQDGVRMFTAAMKLKRRPISGWSLASVGSSAVPCMHTPEKKRRWLHDEHETRLGSFRGTLRDRS